jgi:hypothetical protein
MKAPIRSMGNAEPISPPHYEVVCLTCRMVTSGCSTEHALGTRMSERIRISRFRYAGMLIDSILGESGSRRTHRARVSGGGDPHDARPASCPDALKMDGSVNGHITWDPKSTILTCPPLRRHSKLAVRAGR